MSRTSSGGQRAGNAPGEPLIATIAELRAEVEGLREAAKLRAVIEQAKGVLAERHRISPEQAFARLRQLSQEHNVRLVEVAATVVAMAIPAPEDSGDWQPDGRLRDRLPPSSAASPTWRALTEKSEVRERLALAVLDSVLDATSDGDEGAGLILEFLEPFGVAAVTLYRRGDDECLVAVGQVGVPSDMMSSWRTVPMSVDVALVRAVLDDRPHFWTDLATRVQMFPAVASLVTSFEAGAAIPVHDDGRAVGVVGLMWAQPRDFPEAERAAITSAVERAAPVLFRHVSDRDPDLDWLQAMLALHLDPWLLLGAVVNAHGVITDFVVQDASDQLPRREDWIGWRMFTLWPALAHDGTAVALSTLARTGGHWATTTETAGSTPWKSAGCRLRAVSLGKWVVIAWRPPSGPGERMAKPLKQ